MGRTVTWLHISDLHAGKPGVEWDARRVTTTLIADLKQMASRHELCPDFMFFTGDAAWGQIGSRANETLSRQFKIAGEFFDKVRRAFSPRIPIQNIFLVPGNHDVNWKVVVESQTSWLDSQKDPAKITEIIERGRKSHEWQRYMKRLGAYRAFLKANGFHHLLKDPDRLVYHVKRRTKADVDVCIGGFNTAWSCCRVKERALLWMGSKWQTAHLDFKLEGSGLSIVLMHHPPSWLTEWEAEEFSRDLERAFRFTLHGHEHDAWVTTNDKGHTRIAAGACYQRSDKENGYNFVRLDIERGKGEIWLRRYEPKGAGWVPCLIAGTTDNDGRWRLTRLPWLRLFRDTSMARQSLGGRKTKRRGTATEISSRVDKRKEDGRSSARVEPQTPAGCTDLPEPLKWGGMENTIGNEINELRVMVREKRIRSKADLDRKYRDVQRNILALAIHITEDTQHHLSSNWMDIKKDRKGRYLEISTHQGFYSYLHRRRTFRLHPQEDRKREQGTCGWAVVHGIVYHSPDTWHDRRAYFSETTPGEKLTLRSLINIPVPIIEQGVEYKQATVERAVRRGKKLPYRDIVAVLNIDSPFVNIFSLERLAGRIARLILLAGLLLGVKRQYEGRKHA